MLKINSIQSISLDFVRLFAAQMVVVGHVISFFEISNNMDYMQNGGVVLFFVLSGLIISYTVFYKVQTGIYSFKLFFIERFARIYSGLIPSLVFILVIDFIMKYYLSSYHYNDAYNVKTFIGNIFMLQDYQYIGHYFVSLVPDSYQITSFGSGRPLWTLAIEWWLYMFFGLLYFFYSKAFSKRYFLFLILSSIVPLWNLIYGRGNGLTIYWIFGIIITLLVFQKQNISKKLSLAAAMIFFIFAIVLLLYAREAYNLHFVFMIAGFVFFVLLYQQNNTKQYDNILTKMIRIGAAYSFTLYLIHYSIIEFIISLNIDLNKYILAITSLVLPNIIAYIIAKPTEMRHKRLANILKMRFANAER